MYSANKKFSILWGFMLLTFLSACAHKALDDGEKNMPTKTIEEVLKEHTNALMDIEGVAGVGQGLSDGKDCIKVFVIAKTPELEEKVPDEIEGYLVEMVVSGEITPQQIR
jgi:hypothetical protein